MWMYVEANCCQIAGWILLKSFGHVQKCLDGFLLFGNPDILGAIKICLNLAVGLSFIPGLNY